MSPDGASGPVTPEAADFWQSSGYRLLRHGADGRLEVTGDFLRAYLARPELRPGDESGPAELELHRRLVAEPGHPVDPERVSAVEDPDARENYRLFMAFRDLLLSHGSLEASYLALFRDGVAALPSLFVDQMAHVILRRILEGCRDPFRLRAAELLFRSQAVSIEDGSVLLADEETLEMRTAQAKQSRELQSTGLHVHVEMDVLGPDNGMEYWRRSDRFDLALDVGFTRPGLDALCRVLEAWIAHFLAVDVSIQPVQQVRDERWVWHVGLDVESSAILNALYRGDAVPDDATSRLLSLFRLDFREPADMRADLAGRPVYLAMAMDGAKRLRLKPQNLLVNLPLAASS